MSLHDPDDRAVRYLRLSLTAACPMRCIYCRPARASRLPDVSLIADEIESVVAHLVAHHGLEKIRLTGGEPTARADLLGIIRRIAPIDGLKDLAMTTNGLTLARDARMLRDAGLKRVNVSLDSLDPDCFDRMTGVDQLDRVRDGIDAAIDAGLTPLKLNTVVVRGENDDELCDLLRFAVSRGVEIRFIELMPMGPLADQWAERFVSESEMRQRLSDMVESWSAASRTSSAARRHHAILRDGAMAAVGFISAMSCPFCDACDRIRIASDGSFYPCLMDRPAGSVMPALRPSFSSERFDEILRVGLRHKAAEHPAAGCAVMTLVGG